MIRHIDDTYNIRLSIRESSRYRKNTDYEKLMAYMKELSSHFNFYNCDITVSLIKYPNDCFADVVNVENGVYYITLCGEMSLGYQLLSLVHEFIHINQMQTKILRLRSNGDVIWRGQKYTYKKNGVMTFNRKRVSYKDFPWEVEAHDEEENLKNLIDVKIKY